MRHRSSMCNNTSYVILVIVIVIVTTEAFGPKVGPYDIEIEKVELCEDQGSGKIILGTKITKAGRAKYIYKENFTFGVPIDEHFKKHIEVQKWGNGGWIPKYTEVTLKGCEAIFKALGDFYKSFMKAAGYNLEKCPIPAGDYKCDNWEIELNLGKVVPVIEYGKYRGIVKGYYKDETVGCFKLYVEAKTKAFG